MDCVTDETDEEKSSSNGSIMMGSALPRASCRRFLLRTHQTASSRARSKMSRRSTRPAMRPPVFTSFPAAGAGVVVPGTTGPPAGRRVRRNVHDARFPHMSVAVAVIERAVPSQGKVSTAGSLMIGLSESVHASLARTGDGCASQATVTSAGQSIAGASVSTMLTK